jgi:hypothetical protein
MNREKENIFGSFSCNLRFHRPRRVEFSTKLFSRLAFGFYLTSLEAHSNENFSPLSISGGFFHSQHLVFSEISSFTSAMKRLIHEKEKLRRVMSKQKALRRARPLCDEANERCFVGGKKGKNNQHIKSALK